MIATSSPITALALDGAVVLDLGARELRVTETLRAEGLARVADRLAGAPPVKRPPRSSIPPPMAKLPPRDTRPGGGFGEE